MNMTMTAAFQLMLGMDILKFVSCFSIPGCAKLERFQSVLGSFENNEKCSLDPSHSMIQPLLSSS